MTAKLRLPKVHLIHGVLYADTDDRVLMSKQSDVALASIILGEYPQYSFDQSYRFESRGAYSRKYRTDAATEWLHRYGMDFVCDTKSRDALVDAEARRLVSRMKMERVPVIYLSQEGYASLCRQHDPVELHPLWSLSAWVAGTFPSSQSFETRMHHAYDTEFCQRQAAFEILRRYPTVEDAAGVDEMTGQKPDFRCPDAYAAAQQIIRETPKDIRAQYPPVSV
jgi:hypothetical protein